MFSNPATKTFLLLCGITIAFLAPRSAQAQTFSTQCGVPGTVSCGGSLSIVGGSSLGTIVVNSSGISNQITIATGLPSQISGLDDFKLGAETFVFGCSDVTAFGTAGTFMLVDTDGDFTMMGTAVVGSLATEGGEPLGVGLDLTIQSFSVGGPDDGGTTFYSTGGNGSFGFLLNGDSGLTSSAGNFENFGTFTTATPEPGTLPLLGSGLLSLLAATRRRRDSHGCSAREPSL